MFNNMNQVDHFFQSRKQFGIKPGLDRINILLCTQGNPQHYLKAIHVSGTNGKGSTIQYIKSALLANDYRVGVFTSPSMEGLTGHILDNDRAIGDTTFINLLNKLYPEINRLDQKGDHPSEFEIITVIAFMYFWKTVDIALIETGMGGREDTTNCFIPILSIITNVAMDHTAFLGETVEEIAYQKAGIIKKGVPVIIGNIAGVSLGAIKKEAEQQHAPIWKLNRDFHYSQIHSKDDVVHFLWNGSKETNHSVYLSMKGGHQVENASLTIMALHILIQHRYLIDWNKALKAIRNTKVPGRFELVWNEPTIVIDGAHNSAGISSFLQTVSNDDSKKDKVLIFAGFRDKDLSLMIERCIPYFKSITLTTFDHPRAAVLEELSVLVESLNITMVADWKRLVQEVVKDDDHDKIYYITGSLHFIKEVRKFLGEIV